MFSNGSNGALNASGTTKVANIKRCAECGIVIQKGHWCSGKCQLRYKNKVAGGFYAQNNISNCPKCDQ